VFHSPNATVLTLITFAYRISDRQVVGGPAWIRTDLFEVNARSAGESSDEEKRPMVQSLLEDRFGLRVHHEQRRMKFGSLVMARDGGSVGPGLTQCDEADQAAAPVVWPRGGRLFIRRCALISSVADGAAGILELPVVDRTGLTGRWNVLLAYADSQPSPRDPDPNLVSFRTALQEQLGLKVEDGVGPLDVLVIDWVTQPTEN
jgi:uncharacterized protein (TIGR03435 family)